MILLHGLTDLAACRGGSVSIGNFDGVHLGHQAIVRRLVDQARRLGGPAVVLTFDPHPATLLKPEFAPPVLTRLERKAELLAGAGVEAVVVLTPSLELFQLTPRAFFDSVLIQKLQVQGLVEGPNFFFGRNREGDIHALQAFGRESGVLVEIQELEEAPLGSVSSSEIRRLLAQGDVQFAAKLLGRPHRIEGTVIHGAARGRQLGFPTANLTAIAEQLPPQGVYAGRSVVQGTRYPAAIHLGPNPTFSEGELKLEVHLLGFQGDLYGQTLAVDLLDRVRDVIRFESRDALLQQLQRDLLQVRSVHAAQS